MWDKWQQCEHCHSQLTYINWRLTLGREEGAPRALCLLCKISPEHRGPQDQARGLLVSRDADLVLRDGRVQLTQELVRQVCPAIDAPVVADELLTCHFLLHLHMTV